MADTLAENSFQGALTMLGTSMGRHTAGTHLAWSELDGMKFADLLGIGVDLDKAPAL